jgi:hypothetical protein
MSAAPNIINTTPAQRVPETFSPNIRIPAMVTQYPKQDARIGETMAEQAQHRLHVHLNLATLLQFFPRRDLIDPLFKDYDTQRFEHEGDSENDQNLCHVTNPGSE